MKIKKLLIVLSALIVILLGTAAAKLVSGNCGVLPCLSGECALFEQRRVCVDMAEPCSFCASGQCIVFDHSVPWIECLAAENQE